MTAFCKYYDTKGLYLFERKKKLSKVKLRDCCKNEIRKSRGIKMRVRYITNLHI